MREHSRREMIEKEVIKSYESIRRQGIAQRGFFLLLLFVNENKKLWKFSPRRFTEKVLQKYYILMDYAIKNFIRSTQCYYSHIIYHQAFIVCPWVILNVIDLLLEGAPYIIIISPRSMHKYWFNFSTFTQASDFPRLDSNFMPTFLPFC